MGFLFANRPCLDPATLLRECLAQNLPVEGWAGRANVFKTANGREPGRGHLLLTRADLTAIDQTKSHTLEIFDAGNPKVSLKRITLLSAVCVSPGADADPAAAHVCEVADRRHFLAKIPIDKAFNVKDATGAGHLSATLNSGSPWTWQEIVSHFGTALGVATLTLPFTPHGTPENLTYYGGWAWAALCDVLDRLACAVDYDGAADRFAVVRLGAADTPATNAVARLAVDRVWDGRPVDPVRAWRPEKVRVRFPRRPLPTDGSSPIYTVDTTTDPQAGVEAGTYVQLDDDLTAVGATGTPSNSATLATRAAERVADWLRKRGGYERPVQIVYAGHPPHVGSTILGRLYGRAAWEDRGPGMKAEIGASPDGLLEKWRPGESALGGGLLLATVVSGSGQGPYVIQPQVVTGGVFANSGGTLSNVWAKFPMGVSTATCEVVCEYGPAPGGQASYHAHEVFRRPCVQRNADGFVVAVGTGCGEALPCAAGAETDSDLSSQPTPTAGACNVFGVVGTKVCLVVTGWQIANGSLSPADMGPFDFVFNGEVNGAGFVVFTEDTSSLTNPPGYAFTPSVSCASGAIELSLDVTGGHNDDGPAVSLPPADGSLPATWGAILQRNDAGNPASSALSATGATLSYGPCELGTPVLTAGAPQGIGPVLSSFIEGAAAGGITGDPYQNGKFDPSSGAMFQFGGPDIGDVTVIYASGAWSATASGGATLTLDQFGTVPNFFLVFEISGSTTGTLTIGR